MKVVYLAGPYRADTEYEVHRNIQAAEVVALEVWKLGAVCICPHKNTAYFGGALPADVWLKGSLELVRRSDAVLLMHDWCKSQGARAERTFATSAGIALPVFHSLGALGDWLADAARREKTWSQA
ncbi:MAG: DUF4406 domain-containing protein [Roseateles sp.]